jgi:hypothetical protein
VISTGVGRWSWNICPPESFSTLDAEDSCRPRSLPAAPEKEVTMNLRSLALVSPLVLVLGLAACDDRDYEAELAAMQEELAMARNELQAVQAENERLSAELEEAQAQPEADPAVAANGAPPADGAPPMEAVQAELVLLAERATLALAGLNLLEEEAQVDASEVRQNLEEVVQLAESMVAGVMMEAPPPEPAAGPAADPAQPPPADAETPAEATGVQPPPEVMEEEPQQQQQQQ